MARKGARERARANMRAEPVEAVYRSLFVMVVPSTLMTALRLKIFTPFPESSAFSPTLGAAVDRISAHALADSLGTRPTVAVDPVLALVTVILPGPSPVPAVKV